MDLHGAYCSPYGNHCQPAVQKVRTVLFYPGWRMLRRQELQKLQLHQQPLLVRQGKEGAMDMMGWFLLANEQFGVFHRPQWFIDHHSYGRPAMVYQCNDTSYHLWISAQKTCGSDSQGSTNLYGPTPPTIHYFWVIFFHQFVECNSWRFNDIYEYLW